MFKRFRKDKSDTVLIRAEELQSGDQFMYDSGIIEVLDTIPGNEQISVRLGSAHPAFRTESRRVELYNEILVNVVRA